MMPAEAAPPTWNEKWPVLSTFASVRTLVPQTRSMWTSLFMGEPSSNITLPERKIGWLPNVSLLLGLLLVFVGLLRVGFREGDLVPVPAVLVGAVPPALEDGAF